MGIYTIRLPDVGEGIAEAELVEWHVQAGDQVKEDDVVAAVMTDKAAVEVPSSVSGRVSWLGGEIGDMIPVGGKLIQLEVEGEGNDTEVGADQSREGDVTDESSESFNRLESESTPAVQPQSAMEIQPEPSVNKQPESSVNKQPEPPANKQPEPPANKQPEPSPHKQAQSRARNQKPLAAPSVRAVAKQEGIDLRNVPGSGPAGRINHQDLRDFIDAGGQNQGARSSNQKRTGVKRVKMIGMRRKIAEKMALSKSRIPHITIVEEVQMSELEELRCALNKKHAGQRAKLTLLPFIMRAIVEAVREQPELNARYDDEAGIVYQHEAVNIGVATQTDSGLNVTVVHHAEAGSLWSNAEQVSTLAEAAREGSIKREDLSNGTITITSLGALGAIATTPIINHPEVAIVGVNKMQIRPMWDGQQFQPCKMMNISCSFDHRVIDGWDAALFVQKLKTLLETPAMLFVEA